MNRMEIIKFRNWTHSRTVALIWILSFISFCSILHMALLNSSSPDNNPPVASSLPSELGMILFPNATGSEISNAERRVRLYDKMANDLDEHGPVFLKNGETSQSLSLSDLFTIEDGSVRPVLKAANPPVRANVLYMSTKYSEPISEAVHQIFLPYFDKAIWFQNSSLYHFSMFHASHHISPVPASESKIEAEATAVRAASSSICPLKIVLDRVVLTSTGVLLGCWQVVSGTDPVLIRAKLKAALPDAPEKQLYDTAILHTSFARLLGHPNVPSMDKTSDQLQFFHRLVSRLNEKLKGYEALISELWYVEEYDVLALALNGRVKVRRFQLGCSKS